MTAITETLQTRALVSFSSLDAPVDFVEVITTAIENSNLYCFLKPKINVCESSQIQRMIAIGECFLALPCK